MICTFIGHRDTPPEIQPLLRETLINLITNENADTFYVGNHGAFDSMVRKELKELKKIYPHINYSVVLAYMTMKKDEYEDYSDTIYPDGLEKTPLRLAIIERNKWMIKKSDTLICYVTHTLCGAGDFMIYAQKKQKKIINLGRVPRQAICEINPE